MSMSKFYDQCGELRCVNHLAEGAGNHVKHIVQFVYTNGWANYDGEGWSFTIEPAN